MARPAALLEVLRTGPLTTVQDDGRPGHAALGVSASGAVDRDAYRLANRLVGNPDGAAVLEVTLGGLELRARNRVTLAVTGAVGSLAVSGHGADTHRAIDISTGAVLALAPPEVGLRSYLAVRGGVVTDPVLGSRSTDVLAGLGQPVQVDDLLPIGPAPPGEVPAVDVAAVRAPTGGDLELRLVLGPRDDWFTAAAIQRLAAEPFVVSGDSNRVGMRLDGPALDRANDLELPSEGTVPGGLQVPTSGQPVLFLADHPVTGGYPVIAVLRAADLPVAGQARPGQRIRFRPERGGAL